MDIEELKRLRHLEAAQRMAEIAHHGQFRHPKELEIPFVTHPIEVKDLLADHGVLDEDILMAALLHDTIEDTTVIRRDIVRVFGTIVADYVVECTTDLPGMTVKEKKALLREKAPTWSLGARCIKMADGLSNVKSIAETDPGWMPRSQLGYVTTTAEIAHIVEDDDGPKPPQSLTNAFFKQVYETLVVVAERQEVYDVERAERKRLNKIKNN